MNIDVPSWLTETSLTPYPLTKSFGYDSFLMDAQFVQFDGFVPTLVSIYVQEGNVTFKIQFDLSLLSFTTALSDIAAVGSVLRLTDGDRYLGKLVFGYGVPRIINEVGDNTTFTLNTPFLANTVRSIPSKCGVFAINSVYGDIAITSDSYINYEIENISDTHNITFNAIAFPAQSTEPYLKTLNSVGPTHNSVFIKNTPIIKVAAQNSVVTISMVGTNPSELTKPNAIIVTSDDNA